LPLASELTDQAAGSPWGHTFYLLGGGQAWLGEQATQSRDSQVAGTGSGEGAPDPPDPTCAHRLIIATCATCTSACALLHDPPHPGSPMWRSSVGLEGEECTNFFQPHQIHLAQSLVCSGPIYLGQSDWVVPCCTTHLTCALPYGGLNVGPGGCTKPVAEGFKTFL
jgi:hypothetical protein